MQMAEANQATDPALRQEHISHELSAHTSKTILICTRLPHYAPVVVARVLIDWRRTASALLLQYEDLMLSCPLSTGHFQTNLVLPLPKVLQFLFYKVFQ